MATFKAEGYETRNEELAGWPIRIASYRLDTRWSCRIDNVSPGATIARGEGESRDAAEADALGRAKVRLQMTRRIKVLEKRVDELEHS